MDALPEIFAIKDAISEFDCSDLCNASITLLSAMGYPIKPHDDMGNQKIESFIYFTAQKKVHYNEQEMMYLNQIEKASFLCELQHKDIFNNNNYSEDSIVFLSVEIISSEKERSEVSFFLSKILSKAYDGFVVLLVKKKDNIMFCTCIPEQVVCMSEWYNTNSTYMTLLPLCTICYPYITGVQTVRDYYYELAFGFSRDYIRYPESYEFIAYQALPYIEPDTSEVFISIKQIKEIAEQNIKYYEEKYGYDFVNPDNNFTVLPEEDDELIFLELDDFGLPSDEFDDGDVDEYYVDTDDEDDIHQIDYSSIDDETIKDPVKLLKWLEQKDKAREIDSVNNVKEITSDINHEIHNSKLDMNKMTNEFVSVKQIIT